MLEGIMKYLLENVKSNNDFVWKIIPMVNVDGVIHGNTRAEVTGIDGNRVWNKPSKDVTPAIYHIKKAIARVKE